MKIQEYSNEGLALAKKFISSDALFILVSDALARRTPLSTVRMGDGEKAIMLFSQGAPAWSFLKDEKWLREYGLLGADLKKVAESLFKAANEADYFCPNIYGIQKGNYDVTGLTNQRQCYGEGLYAYSWMYMDRVSELMKYTGGIGIVCRNPDKIINRLYLNYNKSDYETANYDSWKDYDKCLEEIGKMKSHLILISSGASGKYLCVEASRKFGKVVLDVGSGLMNHW